MTDTTRRFSPQTVDVLQALAAQGDGWLYGLEIAAATGLKSGSLYPILVRLNERGLLEGRWLEPEKTGRPPRHAYRITAAGRSALREATNVAPSITLKGVSGMNALHGLARLVLHASVALAPKRYADWTRAMRAEFEAIDDGGPALEWALGCLATAAGWRLKADGGFLLAFLVAVATSIWFRDHWQEYARPGTTWNMFGWDNSMLILGMALPVCVAAGIRRRPTPNAVWLLAIAAAIALSAWVHGHWRDVMHTAAGDSLPALAVAMLVLMLALPGSITAAICWRLRTDTAYLTALVGLIVVAHWLGIAIWRSVPSPSTDQFFAIVDAYRYASLALPCLLLCAYRPDRTLLTLFVTLLLNGGLAGGIATFIPPMLADPFTMTGNHPEVPNVIMALIVSWNMFGTAVISAAAGWTLGTLGRRLQSV